MPEGIATAPRPRGLGLVLRYTAFAALAAAVNLLVQVACMALYQGQQALLLAMAAGTAAGIAPKFLLDKYWIFYDRAPGRARSLWQFILYGLLSVVTTLLFWVFEIAFHWLGDGGPLRYLGAALGLGLGNWVKYHLDRRLVFGGR
jgi:putative flippase GtrA